MFATIKKLFPDEEIKSNEETSRPTIKVLTKIPSDVRKYVILGTILVIAILLRSDWVRELLTKLFWLQGLLRC